MDVTHKELLREAMYLVVQDERDGIYSTNRNKHQIITVSVDQFLQQITIDMIYYKVEPSTTNNDEISVKYASCLQKIDNAPVFLKDESRQIVRNVIERVMREMNDSTGTEEYTAWADN